MFKWFVPTKICKKCGAHFTPILRGEYEDSNEYCNVHREEHEKEKRELQLINDYVRSNKDEILEAAKKWDKQIRTVEQKQIQDAYNLQLHAACGGESTSYLNSQLFWGKMAPDFWGKK